MPHLIAEPGTA